MDEKKIKQHYETPQITRIGLDAKCTVLGFCKNTGQGGPNGPGCSDVVGDCLDIGS